MISRNRKKRSGGFTLLELIAVMAIIVTMALVVAGGYNGIMRAINESSAINAMRNTAMLCRQHAVLDNRRTYFLVTGINKYVLCRYGGKVSDLSGKSSFEVPYLSKSESAYWLFDDYADWSAMAESFTSSQMDEDDIDDMFDSNSESAYSGNYIFDFEESEGCRIKYPPFFHDGNDCWVLGLDTKDVSGSLFAPGNEYGWLLYDEKTLPRGYVFSDDLYDIDSSGDFKQGACFYFDPDGTVSFVSKSGTESESAEITIGEVDPSSPGGASLRNEQTLEIKHDGKMTVK